MINNEFKVQLAEKLAQGIIFALTQKCSKKKAAKHIERLERLVLDGQIDKSYLVSGLRAVTENINLPDDMRNSAMARGYAIIEDKNSNAKKDTISTSLVTQQGLITNDDIDTAIKTNAQQYNIESIITPNSLFAENTASWTQIKGEVLAELYSEIGPVDGSISVNSATTGCYWQPLPWYQNAVLLRLTDSTWQPEELSLYYLVINGQLHRLDGTSPPIHAVNQLAPIEITEDNAIEYLKFFCFFVHGEEGPFYIIETTEDRFLPKIIAPDSLTVFTDNVKPVEFKGVDSKGQFQFSAIDFYANALFQANFLIPANGTIEMTDDNPIAADLPIHISVLLGK